MPETPPNESVPAGLPDWAWPAGVAVVTAVNFIILFPGVMAFQSFVVGDAGWPIGTDAAWADGLIPTVDFAYFYGLLALVLDRGWFALCGRTPAAQAILVGLCVAGTAWGAYRFARAMDLGPAARGLFLVGLPFVTMPVPPPSTVHAFEPLLLVNALALHAAGRLRWALVLVTICGFVKPSMAGVYAVVLTGIILANCRPRDLLPAAGVGFGLAAILAGVFGVGPLLATLFPTTAAELYKAEGYGFFFGRGRKFLLPDPLTAWYYLLTPAGFWVVASVVLVAGAVRAVRYGRGPAAGAVVACAVLHVAFVFFFFGNELSWFYYGFLPVLGACAVVNRSGLPPREPGRAGPIGITVLTLLCGVGQLAQIAGASIVWFNARPDPATGGLYAHPADIAAWAEIRETAKSQKVLLLARAGSSRVLFPEVDSPAAWYMMRPVATPEEIERVRAQIRAADVIVMPHEQAARLDTWPEFAAEIAPFLPPTPANTKSYTTFVMVKRVRPGP